MGRFWQVIDRHKVNIFYTAPTAIRSLQQADLSFVERSDLSSLQVLGSVGEPINEEAWHWYDEHIGTKCRLSNMGQTETGGIMIWADRWSDAAEAPRMPPLPSARRTTGSNG